jgi:drug/metabolite transporter (DMT)-like permease
LAIALASLASLFFGVLAVTMRMCFRSGAAFGPVALATTGGAAVVAFFVALAAHGTHEVTLHSVWPFVVAGVVAPGVSQLLFVRAIELIGASRTAVLVGIAPLLSAGFAIALLGEPVRAGLVAGTLAIVAGGLLLTWERTATRLPALGFIVGGIAAVAIAARDNFVRWAAKENALPGTSAAALSLMAATVFLFLLFGRSSRRGLWEQRRVVVASAAAARCGLRVPAGGARPRASDRRRAALCDGVAVGRALRGAVAAVVRVGGSPARRCGGADGPRRCAHRDIALARPHAPPPSGNAGTNR